MDIKLDFTDNTIIETDGVYEDVKKIMDSELGENPEWMLRSDLVLYHQYGVASFTLNFWHNREIHIAAYNPSVKDFFNNSDLEALNFWAQENGWSKPYVTIELAQNNISYWKYFWSVNVINCLYLDELFGDRKKIDLDIG